MGSAAEAKARLTRLAYQEWRNRVDELLSVAGLTVNQFPDMPYESYYRAGLRAGRVAEVIIGVHGKVKQTSKQG